MSSTGYRSQVCVRAIGRGEAPVGSVYGPRILPCHELVWMQSGAARWICAGRSAVLTPGHLLLAPAGVAATVYWEDESDAGPRPAAGRRCAHAYVDFELRDGGVPEGRPTVIAIPGSDVRHALLRYLLQLGQLRPAGWREPAEAALEAVVRLVASGTLVELGPADVLPDSIERLAAYVHRLWPRGVRPIPLDEMASAAGTSKGHLSRQFRAAFALGPAKAFELLRLAHAASLLVHSNVTVVQAAEACGYASPYHFSRSFSAAFGAPPSVFRATSDTSRIDAVFGRHNLTALAARIWPDSG